MANQEEQSMNEVRPLRESDPRLNEESFPKIVSLSDARNFQLNWKAPICTDPNCICNKKMEVSHEFN